MYWDIVKSSKTLDGMLKKLRTTVEEKNWILAESIHNSYVNIKLIEQKIDESVNRETSFKYEIEKIFISSKFIMERVNDSI